MHIHPAWTSPPCTAFRHPRTIWSLIGSRVCASQALGGQRELPTSPAHLPTRPEVTRYLEVVQNPPDLRAVVASQRPLIVSAASDSVARADASAMRLRDLLFNGLLADPVTTTKPSS